MIFQMTLIDNVELYMYTEILYCKSLVSAQCSLHVNSHCFIHIAIVWGTTLVKLQEIHIKSIKYCVLQYF